MTRSSSLAMRRYSIEPRTRKYVKGYGFLLFARKYKEQLLDTGLDAVKTASKKVVRKAGKLLGNKITDAVTKSHGDKIVKQEPVEGMIISPEKRDEILNKLRQEMEHYQISKLLNDSTVSTFVTKKWIEVNDLSSGQYSVNKNIRHKTSMLRSDLCDYSDAYIVVKGRISVTGTNAANRRNKNLTFKNNALFRSCILKVNNTFIDNAEDLDIVMPMYNLLEYTDSYSMEVILHQEVCGIVIEIK